MTKVEHRVLVALHTGRGENEREHFHAKARRWKREHETVAWALRAHERKAGKPEVPVKVTLQRQGPSNGLDGDNLQGSLKAVRDTVAQWLGVDDADPRVAWVYDQKRASTWGVLVVTQEVRP